MLRLKVGSCLARVFETDELLLRDGSSTSDSEGDSTGILRRARLLSFLAVVLGVGTRKSSSSSSESSVRDRRPVEGAIVSRREPSECC